MGKNFRECIVFNCVQSNHCSSGEKWFWKSTLLKMIASFMKPDSGSIVKHKTSLKVGYVPETTPSHILFTPQEYLYHMGCIRGMAKSSFYRR